MWVQVPPPAPGKMRRPRVGFTPWNAAFLQKSRAVTMSVQMRRWLLQVVAGLIAGLGLGTAIGWLWWPVEYTNTAPAVLRQDYHDDYVVMVATVYEVDGDLERARERLALLDPQNPAAPVIELAERLVAVGGSREDTARLVRLAWAFRAITPALVPYLEGQP